MDHEEARELLEVAAVEPGGLDRLMAGDTPTATALAGHLAACPTCMQEFGRLRQASTILREVVASQPPPELRERTLAFVAAVGRPRGEAASAGVAGVAGAPSLRPLAAPSGPEPTALPLARPAEPEPEAGPRPLAVAAVRPARVGRVRLGWLAAAAALVIVSAGLGGVVGSMSRDDAVRQMSLEVGGLAEVASWTARLDARPDVQRVVLTAAASGGSQVGTLVFSPGTRQLVVVADGLPDPPAGQEYRCWVEVAGARQRLGRMYVSGDVAYWVGDSDALASVPGGATFGVSLANVGSTGGSNPAILSGTLQTS